MATLKQALSEAENRATVEHTERGKQEARVEEVQKELQALVKKHESFELDSKTQASVACGRPWKRGGCQG